MGNEAKEQGGALFTPGPWEVWGGHLTVVAGPAKHNTPGRIGGHRRSICEVEAEEPDDFDNFGDASEEDEANARLIASAPDLYDLALRMDEALSNACDPVKGSNNPLESLRFDIQAAIAAAEGR